MSAAGPPRRITHTLRTATPADIPDIARIFLAGLDLSVPNRKLASEFYVYDRDLLPEDGRLRKRLMREQEQEHVAVAIVDGGVVGGYVNWIEPSVVDGLYKPGEIGFLFVDPVFHGQGLGSALIVHAQEAARRGSAASDHDAAQTTEATRTGSDETIMTVKCFARNDAGIRAYERRGFVKKSEFLEADAQEQTAVLAWNGS